MFLPTEQRIVARSGDGSSRQKFSLNDFPADYYTSGNYKDYLTRSDRYDKMANELHQFFFHATGVSSILDFGCAVGFLVNGFNKLGYSCKGYDKSTWPVEYGTNILGNNFLTTDYKIVKDNYHAILALDVFEHMSLGELHQELSEFKTNYLLVRIPVCQKDGEDFVLPVSRNDPTHITCMSKNSWKNLFSIFNFTLATFLALDTIWDSPGVLSAIFHREQI